MTTFDTLGLSAQLLHSVADAGFTETTAVQARAIPLLLEGRCPRPGAGVKNGSITWPMISPGIPVPVSLTFTLTYGPSWKVDPERCVCLIDLNVGGLDGQLAALGHGITGVDGKVE